MTGRKFLFIWLITAVVLVMVISHPLSKARRDHVRTEDCILRSLSQPVASRQHTTELGVRHAAWDCVQRQGLARFITPQDVVVERLQDGYFITFAYERRVGYAGIGIRRTFTTNLFIPIQ